MELNLLHFSLPNKWICSIFPCPSTFTAAHLVISAFSIPEERGIVLTAITLTNKIIWLWLFFISLYINEYLTWRKVLSQKADRPFLQVLNEHDSGSTILVPKGFSLQQSVAVKDTSKEPTCEFDWLCHWDLHKVCSFVPHSSCRDRGGSSWLGSMTLPSQVWQHCSLTLAWVQNSSHFSPLRPVQGRDVQFRMMQPPHIGSSWPSLYSMPLNKFVKFNLLIRVVSLILKEILTVFMFMKAYHQNPDKFHQNNLPQKHQNPCWAWTGLHPMLLDSCRKLQMC